MRRRNFLVLESGDKSFFSESSESVSEQSSCSEVESDDTSSDELNGDFVVDDISEYISSVLPGSSRTGSAGKRNARKRVTPMISEKIRPNRPNLDIALLGDG